MNSSQAKLQVIAPRPQLAALRNPFGDPESSLTESLKVLFSKTSKTSKPSRLAGKLASPHRERRATPRIPIELCCEERTGKRPYYRTTYDLSTFGLSTQYGHTYPIGTLLAIRLHLPDDLRNPLDLTAEVVGTREDSAGMRLAFRNSSADSVRRIHKYLFAYSTRTMGQA